MLTQFRQAPKVWGEPKLNETYLVGIIQSEKIQICWIRFHSPSFAFIRHNDDWTMASSQCTVEKRTGKIHCDTLDGFSRRKEGLPPHPETQSPKFFGFNLKLLKNRI